MKETALPPEWRVLQGKVNYVVQVSNSEFCCSCPSCGGSPHDDGSLPDRCRLFVDGNHPRLFCRKCGLVAFPDQFGDNSYSKPSLEQIEQWRKEQVAREEARKRSAERALQNLRDSFLWERYRKILEDSSEARKYWESRGVPTDFQGYWGLGWDPLHRFFLGGNVYDVTTANFPVPNGANLINIKHRIVSPPEKCPKYLPEISGQGQQPFICNIGEPLEGEIIVVEGEIKAMVTFIHLDDAKYKVIGIPGKTPSEAILRTLEKAERVVLVFDPDAEKAAREFAQKVGPRRTRILIPPMKIDDGILAGLEKREVQRLLSRAMPV